MGAADELALDTRSAKTARVTKGIAMATCPSGHESASDDFCDVCGIMIGVMAGPGRARAPAGLTRGGVPAGKCPRCGVSRVGPFCEACGYNFTFAGGREPLAAVTVPPVTPAPATPAPATLQPPPAEAVAVPPGPVPPSPAAVAGWTAVVTADRAYYDSVRAAAD